MNHRRAQGRGALHERGLEDGGKYVDSAKDIIRIRSSAAASAQP